PHFIKNQKGHCGTQVTGTSGIYPYCSRASNSKSLLVAPKANAADGVATEDVTMTEWTIKNLMDFHVTFGSVCPPTGVTHSYYF
ncbi:MAG: hypothetical protein WBM41_18065, partial [Arenicellales bacterium]